MIKLCCLNIQKLLFATALLWLPAIAISQERVHIKIKGEDQPRTWWASEVDSIFFDIKQTVPEGVTLINLGLSSGLQWASVNYTSNGKELFPPFDADPVKADWGVTNDEGWRTPSKADFEELINGCTWTYEKDFGFVGISKTNSKQIRIPYTATTDDDEGYYWTSDSYYLYFKKGRLNKFEWTLAEKSEVTDEELAIRPVWSEKAIPAVTKSVTVNTTVPSIGMNEVSLALVFSGDYKDATAYGIIYSPKENLQGLLTFEQVDNSEIFVKTVSNVPSSAESITLIDLTSETTYNYRAFAYSAEMGYQYQSSNGEFTTDAEPYVNPNEKFPVPSEPVNLGLPSGVRWSPWNIGANVENGTGGYYGWGDPDGTLREPYNSNYAGGHVIPDIADTLNLRNYDNTLFLEGKDSIVTYDIAYKQWQDKWRLPRRADFDELYKYCTFKQGYWKGDQQSTKGWIIKSTVNGDSIFIPMSGNISNVNDSVAVGIGLPTSSFYWTSEAEGPYPYRYMIEEKKGTAEARTYRFEFYPIRPVYDGNPSPIIIDPTKDPSRTIIGYDEGNTTAIPADGVDFGLPSGVKWAAWNVGAMDYGEAGKYYGWAETYSSSNFTSNNYLSGYSEDVSYPIKDKGYPSIASETQYKTTWIYDDEGYVIGSERERIGWRVSDYDVATQLWGGYWRFSTVTDWNELFQASESGEGYEYINVEWTEENGLEGIKISGKKYGYTDNYIFLPAGGRMTGQSVNYGLNIEGFYWTGTGATGSGRNTTHAKAVTFDNTEPISIDVEQLDRFLGMLVRPVLDPYRLYSRLKQ